MLINRRGSFLIEAMLAAVILSCAVVVLIRSYTGAMNAVRAQDGYTKAAILLHDELDALMAKGFVARNFNNSHSRSADGSTFEVQISARPVSGRKINEVKISVSWPPISSRQRSISTVTYLLDEEPAYAQK